MKISALAITLLLSGCFGVGSGPEEIQWGLGLDTSVHPEPAPYSEDPDDLNHVFALANASIEALYGRCKTDSQESWVRGQAKAWSFRAFEYLRDACDKEGRLIIKAEADAAIANGTVDSLIRRYKEELEGAVERVGPLVDALPAPGTYADAEFQAWLQKEFSTASAGLRRGQEFVANYYNHTGEPYNELGLDTALINYKGAARALEALEHFLAHYEWQPGACTIPDSQDLVARHMVRFNRTAQIAESLADPEDAKGIGNPYGYLINNLGPRIEGAYRRDWPLVMLWQQVELDFYVAFWENYTAARLPTLEEAEYLLALHHSKVRSLPTEEQWEDEEYWVGMAKRNRDLGSNVWEEQPYRAVRPMALQAVTWPFAILNCQREGPETP